MYRCEMCRYLRDKETLRRHMIENEEYYEHKRREAEALFKKKLLMYNLTSGEVRINQTNLEHPTQKLYAFYNGQGI